MYPTHDMNPIAIEHMLRERLAADMRLSTIVLGGERARDRRGSGPSSLSPGRGFGSHVAGRTQGGICRTEAAKLELCTQGLPGRLVAPCNDQCWLRLGVRSCGCRKAGQGRK